jgi:cell wall-associated NlpC family hydrolase
MISTTNPQPGDLIVYKNNRKKILHSGIYLGDGKVKSKFGKIPCIYEHNVFDVPYEYGSIVKFYKLNT